MGLTAEEVRLRSLVRVYHEGRPDEPGMGVFTAKGHVITVAHVIPNLPDPNKQALLGIEGERVELVCSPIDRPELQQSLSVLSVDPCSDIAVLGQDDPSPGDEGWLAFTACLSEPALHLAPFQRGQLLGVSIRTHLGEWVDATGRVRDPASPLLPLSLTDPAARIIPGTSGSPAFDEQGRVVGIVNKAREDAPLAQLALLATALPAWVHLIEREQ